MQNEKAMPITHNEFMGGESYESAEGLKISFYDLASHEKEDPSQHDTRYFSENCIEITKGTDSIFITRTDYEALQRMINQHTDWKIN